MSFNTINKCRVCGESSFITILDLGSQALTGYFPSTVDEEVEEGPLELLKCNNCSLIQLKHSFSPEKMYGEDYGYRSGLNKSMVNHLKNKVKEIEDFVEIKNGDAILDIGSNDGSLLGFYSNRKTSLIGMDPTSKKFEEFYEKDVKAIAEFFSANEYLSLGIGKAKVVTSISMFYDLEDPVRFAKDVSSILHEEGVWHLEQSYLPLMLETNSYDTICHEHLEYYSLSVIEKILSEADLRVISVNFNDVNGGSFAISACRENSNYKTDESVIIARKEEEKLKLHENDIYKSFEARVVSLRTELNELLEDLKKEGKSIYGYGASTKGNVTLQFCNIDSNLLEGIVEVNENKFNKFTPGSRIPIIDQEEIKLLKPDYLLVLPWHFRKDILAREGSFLEQEGINLIFPFPNIEIV